VNRGLRAAVTGAAAAALAVGMLTATVTAQASTARAGIAGTHPVWATAAERMSSRTVTSGTVSARVYLAGRDPAGLAAFAMAVSTPGNARYGAYLTPAQVMARYGPTRAQVNVVRSWLSGAGLTVTTVKDEPGGYVAVRGSVGPRRARSA
jgi:subtilase family serine protease